MLHLFFITLLVITLAKKKVSKCSVNQFDADTQSWTCGNTNLKSSSSGCICEQQFDLDQYDPSLFTSQVISNCGDISCDSTGHCSLICSCMTKIERRLVDTAHISTRKSTKCDASAVYVLKTPVVDTPDEEPEQAPEEIPAEVSETNEVEVDDVETEEDEATTPSPTPRPTHEQALFDGPKDSHHAHKSSSNGTGWKIVTIIMLLSGLVGIVIYILNGLCLRFNEDRWRYWKRSSKEWVCDACALCGMYQEPNVFQKEDTTPFLAYGSDSKDVSMNIY